ncbi:MAG: hypothetical protein IJQ47_03365 [Synergistaceae bacterium]|nr:hypothetical protein [Synergistaceae bacterium]
MPIPLILGAIGLYGAGKVAGAYVDNDNARKINAEARDIVDYGERLMEAAQERTTYSLQALGRKKTYVLNNSIQNFVQAFSQIKNVNFNEPTELNELGKFQLDSASFEGLREMNKFASALSSAAATALMSFGAYGTASILGLASGSVASVLSGFVTSNATLAFLTGGSIATGVTSVLGGTLAAPALAVLGIFLESSASKNLSDAKSNKAQALRFVKEIELAKSMCGGICRRAYIYERLLMRLDILLSAANKGLVQTISASGTDYGKYSPAEKKTVAAAASLAKAVKTILDTPILTKEGNVTQESLDSANEDKTSIIGIKIES